MRKLMTGNKLTKCLGNGALYVVLGGIAFSSTGCLTSLDPNTQQQIAGQSGQDGKDGADGQNGLDGSPGVNCWDLNGNSIDDPDEDVNADGEFNALDCQALPDRDFDGVPDRDDNCPDVENAAQEDDDQDGVGDACDVCPGADDLLDSDNDGRPDCFVSAAALIIDEPDDVFVPDAVTAFNFDVIDGSGHTWDLTSRGEVSDGEHAVLGTSDAFDTFVSLRIDGTSFLSQSTAGIEDIREVVYGPEVMSDLTVTRKVYVSLDDGFARWLDVIANDTVNPITFEVAIDGNLGSDESNPFVFESTDGDLFIDSNDTWWVNCQDAGDDPCVAAFASGALTIKSDDDFDYEYGSITLEPGQRVIFMTFVAMRSFDPNQNFSLGGPVDDLVGLMKEIESFPAVDARFLDGMSAAELRDVHQIGGTHLIRGVPTSVAPNAEIVVTNTATGLQRTVRADSTGAWQAAIVGQSGDEVEFAADDNTGGLIALP